MSRYRTDWLGKLTEAGVHRRAERLYQQLDVLQSLRQEARRDLLAESQKHSAARLLRRIPCRGPIRAALLIAFIQTPHRFPTKRQLWAYSGLAIETRHSGEYRYVKGQLLRAKKHSNVRGLNKNHNHDLKYLFKSTAMSELLCWPLARFLRRSRRSRNQARHGTPNPGAQDRGNHFDRLEERRTFRRRTSKTASSLSIWSKAYTVSPGFSSWRWSVRFS